MAELLKSGHHQCKVCHHFFSRKIKLRHHMTLHTQEENILYGDVFSFPSPVWSKKVHQPQQNKYVCQTCSKRYEHVGYFRRHMWVSHRIGGGRISTKHPRRKKGQQDSGWKLGKDHQALIIPRSQGKTVKVLPKGTEHPRRKRGQRDSGWKLGKDEQAPIKPRNQGKTVKDLLLKGRARGRQKKHFQLTDPEGKTYYECPECKKRVTQVSTLRAHQRIHTGERPYHCPHCSMTFTFYQCLWNHTKKHTEQKHFQCDICPKSFRYYQCLWNHYRSHTGEKPYECGICKHKFPTSSCLTYHIKRHLKDSDCEADLYPTTPNISSQVYITEMPFACEVCHKKFRLKCSLLNHMKRHSCESPVKQSVLPLKMKNCHDTLEHPNLSVTKAGALLIPCMGKPPRGRPKGSAGLKKVGGREPANIKQPKRFPSRKCITCSTCKNLLRKCLCHRIHRKKSKSEKSSRHFVCINTDKHRVNQPRKKLRVPLAGTINSSKRKSGDRNPSSESPFTVRRSRRVAGESAAVLACKMCGQWFTSATDQERHLRHHRAHRCLKCNKSFGAMSTLTRHLQYVHGEGKEARHLVAHHSMATNIERHKEKSRQCKCLHCGTTFLSPKDFESHQVLVPCRCGQQFSCGYIYCLHLSTCKGEIIPAEGTITNQDTGVSWGTDTTTNSAQQHEVVCCPNLSSLHMEWERESSQLYSNWDLPLNLSCDNSSSSAPPHQSHQPVEWTWQPRSRSDPLEVNGGSSEEQLNGCEKAGWSWQSDYHAKALCCMAGNGENQVEKSSDEREAAGWSCQTLYVKETLDDLQVKSPSGVDSDWRHGGGGGWEGGSKETVCTKKTVKCAVCSKKFSSLSQLTDHAMNHIEL